VENRLTLQSSSPTYHILVHFMQDPLRHLCPVALTISFAALATYLCLATFETCAVTKSPPSKNRTAPSDLIASEMIAGPM
jgi:hypothetical protein